MDSISRKELGNFHFQKFARSISFGFFLHLHPQRFKTTPTR